MRSFSLAALALRANDETTAAPAPATDTVANGAPAIVAPAGTKPSKAALRALANGTAPTVKRTPKLNAKPAATTTKPAPVKPSVAAKPTGPARGVTRTIATIARHATNFDQLSDRDEAYLAFYAAFAKRASNGIVTVADIAASGRKPAYNGSSKPHDAGVINRLTKAGLIAQRDGSASFTFTANGKAHKLYTTAKA